MSNSLLTIDCEYVQEQLAAAYLRITGEGKNREAAIIETNTSLAASKIAKAIADNKLAPDQVRYIIVTHVHLDHAGGASTLLKMFPQAKLVAHPKAARHLINPSKLIESASEVYGLDRFKSLYGEILPAPESRVFIPENNSELNFGESTFRFIYTKGHANHHFVVVDDAISTVYTGDSFGLAYPALQKGNTSFLFASTSPTDFDYDEAVKSVELIVNCGADRAALTHFGIWSNLEEGKRQILYSLGFFNSVYLQVLKEYLSPGEQHTFAKNQVQNFLYAEISKRFGDVSEAQKNLLEMDIDLNAQGIVFAAQRALKRNMA